MQTQLKYRTLIDVFNGSLAKVESPEKVCLEILRMQRQEKITFGQLKARAQDFALWLYGAKDIRVNDKVAILGKNRVDWDVAFWGTILAGAVPVLIDPDRPVEGVKNHVLHTDTRLIVMADDYQDADSRRQLCEFASGDGLGLVEMTETPLCVNSQGAGQLPDAIRTKIKPDDTAVILCTSGTTGDPREVELTHVNLIANIQGTLEKIKITSDDKLGHITPPHHSLGLTVSKLLTFWVGATNIYTNKYRRISQLIKDREITVFVGIPALFTVLAKKVEEGLAEQKKEKLLLRLLDRFLPKLVGKRIIEKQGWGKLRFFLSGAAPIPRWVLELFRKRGLNIYEGYGTTENSPVYGFNEEPDKLGSVGRPITTMSVKIVDEQGCNLPPGKNGEITLGGPCVMKGYYKNPGATQAVISVDDEGVRWLHTGDLGYLDEDGYLFITGRKKYVIVLPGGKNVNPERVESALSQADYVKEVLIVPGFRENSAGKTQEAVKAIVQPDWDVIQSDTSLAYTDLVKQPQKLKTIVWQSINETQQKSRRLSKFERVSSSHLEIKLDEFQKTSTGKIKRQAYLPSSS